MIATFTNKCKCLPQECLDCSRMKVLNRQRRSSLLKSMTKLKHKLESENEEQNSKSYFCWHGMDK